VLYENNENRQKIFFSYLSNHSLTTKHTNMSPTMANNPPNANNPPATVGIAGMPSRFAILVTTPDGGSHAFFSCRLAARSLAQGHDMRTNNPTVRVIEAGISSALNGNLETFMHCTFELGRFFGDIPLGIRANEENEEDDPDEPQPNSIASASI
jgi:hypothetical protein